MNAVVVNRNLLMPTSTGRHPSADRTDWTGRWVCVGLAEQLVEVGAVLPATIGHHATHVRRTATGLIAAINARPFGGCVSIPVHCGSTRNVKCPHLACAFSEDGDVLDARSDPTGSARAQFVGDGRRTVTLPLAQRGSLVFVNVTMAEPPPLPVVARDGGDVVTMGRRLLPGNWLDTPARVASAVVAAFDGGGETPSMPVPNLVTVGIGADVFVALSHPAGHTRSTVVWALLRTRARGTGRIDPPGLAEFAAAGFAFA